MENQNRIFKRGDMVKCNYAPGEYAVGEVVGYEPNGDIELIISITRKRTRTVDKVKTILKPNAVEAIILLYLDEDEAEDEAEDEENN